MNEKLGGSREYFFGFPHQSHKLQEYARDFIEKSEIIFDEHGVWRDEASGLCIVEERDGSFYKPEDVLSMPVRVQIEGRNYEVYELTPLSL